MPKAFLKTDSIADSITAIYDGKDLNLTKNRLHHRLCIDYL